MTTGSFLVGLVVGLTGMGGGALMTPMLVLFFGVQPLAAVSSDLVASVFMKPFGGLVHLKRRTVHLGLVKWLCVGSVPAAFAGALLIKLFGHGEQVQRGVQIALGVALLVAAAGIAAKAYTSLRESRRSGDAPPDARPVGVVVRPVPTAAIGAVGGLVVGLTSVGSGSLIIVALLLLYPTLRANRLVGTDLVQAVPLVVAAALGHVLFGDFQFAVTASVLVGSIPGVLLGALGSSRLPGGVIRRALVVVLVASALKMLGAGNVTLVVALVAAALAAIVGWTAVRRAHGLPALPHRAGAAATSSAPESREPARSSK
ncbi:MAG: sulfite exporter TauE/SafE family protein [Streptosporangiales bacterium]|nr:sulfite exporter TauE/SafE family protein [Streptosporangiales bacterium]